MIRSSGGFDVFRTSHGKFLCCAWSLSLGPTQSFILSYVELVCVLVACVASLFKIAISGATRPEDRTTGEISRCHTHLADGGL